MFKCDKCGVTTQPRQKCHKVPTRLRRKVYRSDDGERGRPRITVGFETVTEGRFCERCLPTAKKNLGAEYDRIEAMDQR